MSGNGDVIIWGGTVCGVTAAIAAIRTDPDVKVLWLVSGDGDDGGDGDGGGGGDGGGDGGGGDEWW